MKHYDDIAVSVKSFLTIALATIASGFAQFIQAIPDDIGKLASLLGAILTIATLIYVRAQTRKVNLECDLLILRKGEADTDA
jgi:hypothetical protein